MSARYAKRLLLNQVALRHIEKPTLTKNLKNSINFSFIKSTSFYNVIYFCILLDWKKLIKILTFLSILINNYMNLKTTLKFYILLDTNTIKLSFNKLEWFKNYKNREITFFLCLKEANFIQISLYIIKENLFNISKIIICWICFFFKMVTNY